MHFQRFFGTGLALLAVLALVYTGPVAAVTYTNAATTFSWIDASTHAQLGPATTPYKFSNTGGCGSTPPIIDDSLSDNIPMGFTFNYGGVAFTQVRVMSNGRLQFNNNTTCGFGSPVTQLPYPNAGLDYTLRIYGNDLDPTAKSDVPAYNTNCLNRTGCYVSYATLGTAPNRQFVVTWYHVPEWTAASTAGGSYDLQVILKESGEFVYQFGNDTPGPGNTNAQVGWQINSTDYSVPNVGFPSVNSAIRFYIPSPISELRMDEGTWTGAGSVINSSGGTNATPVGLAQAVAGGKLCRGGNIPANGSSATIDAIDTGYDVDSQIGSSGTIGFWYKSNGAWSGTSSSDGQLLDATVVNNQWFYLVKQNGNGRLSFNLTDNANSTFQVLTGNNSFAANTWVHIAVSWNLTPVAANNRLRIYINGVLAVSTAVGTIQPLSSQIGTLYVGDNRSSFVTNPGTGISANGVFDELRIYNYEATAAVVLRDYTDSRTCPTLDHVRLNHTGAGVTCTGSSITVNACGTADVSGVCTANVDGISGNVVAKSAANALLVTVPFSIPAGSSSAVISVPVTTPQTVTFETSGLSVSPVNSWTCWDGTSASCSHVYSDSGFIFDVPHHVSEVAQTVTVSAVKKSNSSLACTPAFASVSRDLTFKCSYGNPTTGTLPVRMKGSGAAFLALNAGNSVAAACDGTGQPVTLAFNASGVASSTVQYADVGNMTLSASYAGSVATGDTGLSMTGTDTFIAAPKDFQFSAITPGLIKAGNTFSATVTARNNAGNATPNFGKENTLPTVPEGATVTFTKYQPSGAGSVTGSLAGSLGAFTGGAATGAAFTWSEVGTIDLTATLTNSSYLGSGLAKATGTTGTTGAVGRFIPDHFDTVVTLGCSAGGFTYSGQPFTLVITAMNGLAAPAKTFNYDGTASTSPNFSKVVTLSDANGIAGTFAVPNVLASAFTSGAANVSPSFSFTSKLTAPSTIKLRAVDSDGVSSSTGTEGTSPIRSGRVRITNMYGSERLDLSMPLELQYYNGTSFVRNTLDTCTSFSAANVNLINYQGGINATNMGLSHVTAVVPFAAGLGSVTLSKPSPAPTSLGSLDLILNLGSIGAPITCPTATPTNPLGTSTSAAKPYLSGNWCSAAAYDRDPSARATFGVYKSPLIYRRENY